MKIRGINLGIALILSEALVKYSEDISIYLFTLILGICLLNWYIAFDNEGVKE